MEHEVVGRDDALGQVERFVERIAEQAQSLTIQGQPGIGKTTLWRAAIAMAEEHGYRVLVSRPTEAETRLAYSSLADLLAEVEPSLFDVLPEPQREAIDVALLLARPARRSPDPRTVFAAFGGALANLAAGGPVLVAIDDRQWLDKSSAAALDYVGRRLGAARIGILTTTRATATSDAADVLALGPMTAAALHRMISSRLRVRTPRPTVLRIHRETGGNPLFALELARNLVVAGLPSAAEPWSVPDDLQEVVAARIRLLPKHVRAALLSAAATAQPTIDALSAPAIRAAARAEIVTVAEDGRVRFAHPLFASAVYSTASPAERRAAHSALAAAATDIEERARHRANACDGPDEAVAELLDRAALEARARGAPDVAAELQERAVALTPLGGEARARERSLTAAEYHLRAGDLSGARTLLGEVVAAAGKGPARSRALRLLGEVCYRLRYIDEAIAHLRDAIVQAGGDPGLTARAELDLMFVLIYSFGSFEEAHTLGLHALDATASGDDDGLRASVLAGVAIAGQLANGNSSETLLTQALALEDHESAAPVEQRPSFLAGWSFLFDERLDRARDLFEALRERLIRHGADADLSELLAPLALVELQAGNLRRAAAHAELGCELSREEGSATRTAMNAAMRAYVAAHAGRVADAREAAAESMALAAESGWQVAAFWASVALGHLELALGNDALVVETLARSIALVERDGIGELSRRPFLPDAIEALIRLGDLDRAERLTDQLEQQGHALARSCAIVAGARCRALLLAARGDIGEALEHVERALHDRPTIPIPLELARTLIVKGQLERRRKQRGAAASSFRRAIAICDDIGAELWAMRARSELARTGAVRSDAELTPSEERVAQLAAAGMANREIAAAVFMSQKTVEANLSRVYRKLGIRSRAELGVRLAAMQSASSEPGGG